jgi:hypothetical protein
MTYRAAIQDHIPLPEDNWSLVRNKKKAWPFEGMSVGQSFIMDDIMLSTARQFCSQAKRAGYGKFYAATVIEDGAPVTRVWKILEM